MSEEFTRYLDGVFDLYDPKRTRHRKSLPPCIFCGISNLINKLKTQKRLLENKPTAYRKQLVLKLENQVTKSLIQLKKTEWCTNKTYWDREKQTEFLYI